MCSKISKRVLLMAIAFSLVIIAGGCAGQSALDNGGNDGGNSSNKVVVGSANFTEQVILGNMYAEVLKDHDIPVELRLNIGSRNVLFPALRSGEIDLVPEYSGALLTFLVEKDVEVRKPEAVMDRLREALSDSLVALNAAEAQDKGTLAVLPETAKKYNLKTYSDLAPVADQLVVGGPPEMPTRYSGLKGMQEVYGIKFREFRALDSGGPLSTQALSSGKIDVARVFTTQGVVSARGWVVLEDDKNLELAQNIVPIIREEALTEEVRKALNELSSTLTTEDLKELNKRVDVDKENPEDVARDYLKKQGLIG